MNGADLAGDRAVADAGGRMPTGARVAAALGLVLHLAIGVFPYSATGLLAPLWGIVLVGVVWLALLLVAVVLIRRRRGWPVLAVPPAALALWALILTLGDRLLGWTA